MRIRLAENFRAVFYAPFYAALALGFYSREGVEIELVNSAVPGEGVAGLFDGTVDITWGGPMRVIKANDQNPESPLICFGEVVGRDPFCLIGRRPSFRLADLTSLRFAAVSEVPTPWMCLQHDLREHGIDPERLVRAPERPMAANFEALCRNEIDVVQLFEPFVSLAAEQGAGDVLYAASSRGPTVYTTFIARRDSLARRTVPTLPAWCGRLPACSIGSLSTMQANSPRSWRHTIPTSDPASWRARSRAAARPESGRHRRSCRGKALRASPKACCQAAMFRGCRLMKTAWRRHSADWPRRTRHTGRPIFAHPSRTDSHNADANSSAGRLCRMGRCGGVINSAPCGCGVLIASAWRIMRLAL